MILVNNAGSFSEAYAPLRHARWNGWTFTDTVFPFFLWIVGVALTLSTAKRVERGEDRGQLMGHAFRRAAIIFALGYLLYLIPEFNFPHSRILGVLQRIAICYLAAAVIFLWTTWRGQVAWLVGVNAAYWALMKLYPVPGCGAGSMEPGCNLEKYIDWIVLGAHNYAGTKTWDPEGIVSTLPAIGTALFGVLAGHLLRMGLTPKERIRRLAVTGIALCAAGYLLSIWMPINKQLWTPSYAALMAGLASLCLAAWDWIAHVRDWSRWFRPLEIYGMNAIAMYVLSGLLEDAGMTSGFAKAAYDWLSPLVNPLNASLLYSVANVVVCYLAAWWMYRRGWFLKF